MVYTLLIKVNLYFYRGWRKNDLEPKQKKEEAGPKSWSSNMKEVEMEKSVPRDSHKTGGVLKDC